MLMRQAASLLAAELSLGELFERLTRMLAEYIDSSVVFIALAKPDDRHAIEYVYDHGEVRPYPHIPLVEPSRALHVIRTGSIVWGNHPSEWAPNGATPMNVDRPWTNDTESAIFVPMRAAGTTVGCLSVQSVRTNAYDEREVEVIAAIGQYLGVAVHNQRMYQTLARTAEYDPLTGLANHSKLSRDLDEALAGATAMRPTVAILLDIVNFATFNETFGYAAGDDVLRHVARALREFEDPDGVAVGRFGGDTFMVLLCDWEASSVEPFIQRLARRLRALGSIQGDRTLPVSLAFGYVVAPKDATTRADVIGLCVHRARLSRTRNCLPTASDERSTLTLYGEFEGVEAILDGLLDRDPYTRVHVLHVNSMAKRWAQYNLDLDAHDLGILLRASLLHDVGKLLVTDRILVKPSRLSEDEYRTVQLHALYGHTILATQDGFAEVAEVVHQHHEHWDGNGYPRGLRGEEIHRLARAVSILDSFSAMVDDRPYHRGITEAAALAELERCAGTQFDPELVERFVRWREEGR